MTTNTTHGIRVLKAADAPSPPRTFLDELFEAMSNLGADEVIELTGKTTRAVGGVISRVALELGRPAETWAAGGNVYVRPVAQGGRAKRTGSEPPGTAHSPKREGHVTHAPGKTVNGTACGRGGAISIVAALQTCLTCQKKAGAR